MKKKPTKVIARREARNLTSGLTFVIESINGDIHLRCSVFPNSKFYVGDKLTVEELEALSDVPGYDITTKAA